MQSYQGLAAHFSQTILYLDDLIKQSLTCTHVRDLEQLISSSLFKTWLIYVLVMNTMIIATEQ